MVRMKRQLVVITMEMRYEENIVEIQQTRDFLFYAH